MKYILSILLLAGCASKEFRVGTAVRYDNKTEESYGTEIEYREQESGAVFGLGTSYTPKTSWGRDRITIKPKAGVWFKPYKDYFVEIGGSIYLVPNWTSGTYAELVPYLKLGYDYTDWMLWVEINHQASNADSDTFGEHPRRPGIGLALGITRKW